MGDIFSGEVGISVKSAWWLVPDCDTAKTLFQTVEALVDMQKTRRAAYLHFLRLYSNRYVTSMSASAFTEGMDVNGNRIRLNVGKSAVDSSTAFIASSRPKPLYTTDGGNYSQRERAKRRGKFVTGLFYRLKQYMLSLQVYLDAALFGDGYEYVYPTSYGTIGIERVLPDELVVDDNDGRDGKPTIMYRIKEIPRMRALELWGEDHKDAIMAAKRSHNAGFGVSNYQQTMDLITVVQAWKLPVANGEKGGIYVMCLNNVVLEQRKWKRDHFPIAHMGWNFAPIGFCNIGAIEEMAPIMVEVNFIAQKIQRLMTLATTLAWKEKGSFVGEINNQDMAMREYTGKPPTFQTVTSVSSEFFSHLDRLVRYAYELVGISQLQATGKIPAGLESGEAIRMVNDVGSKRFQHIGQRYEQFHLDVGELMLDAAEDLREVGGSISVLAAGDKDIERLVYDEIRMGPDDYILQAHPISIIPNTPAGKIETFQKLAPALPQMAPWMAHMLTGIPDLEHAVQLVTAPIDYIERSISMILTKGKYEAPDENAPIDMARDIAQRSLLRARIDEAPQDRLDLLQRYLEECDAMQKKIEIDMQLEAAKQAQAAGGSMGQPGGMGMPQVPMQVTQNPEIRNIVAPEITLPGMGGVPFGSGQ